MSDSALHVCGKKRLVSIMIIMFFRMNYTPEPCSGAFGSRYHRTVRRRVFLTITFKEWSGSVLVHMSDGAASLLVIL